MKKTKTTVHRIPLTEARADLRQAARRGHRKQEYLILEEDGTPIAGMMDTMRWRIF